MRLVSWNCQAHFAKKEQKLLELMPDIAIVQECEPFDRVWPAKAAGPRARHWTHGRSKTRSKGLAILAYSDAFTLALDEYSDPNLFCLLPTHVGARTAIDVLALWENGPKLRKHEMGTPGLALESYRNFLASGNCIYVGDFNNSAIWDAPGKANNFMHVADTLANQFDMVSAYHEFHGLAFGKERDFTFYLYRKRERAFHIDFCFIPRSWVPRIHAVEIGSHSDWSSYSDHSPLIVDLSLE